MLSLPGPRFIQSLVGELRSHKPRGAAKKEKKKKRKTKDIFNDSYHLRKSKGFQSSVLGTKHIFLIMNYKITEELSLQLFSSCSFGLAFLIQYSILFLCRNLFIGTHLFYEG